MLFSFFIFHFPLLAWGLAHPGMLGWLAAAAAPILIHLWSRRRWRETTWAAMEYLVAALRQSRRRLLIEHWLLLAVRTLIVVLAVLAVAEPLLETSGLSAAPGERKHRVLVIDGSFSMGYRAGDKTRFEQAKEIAARMVEESRQGDGFTLVLMSDPPRVVVGKPALETRGVLDEIRLLDLPHTKADLPRTLREVEQVLLAARREEPRLTREEIYFLTDLGRVGWSLEHLDPAALAEFRERSRRLAESASIVVIDLGQPDAENVAVTAVRARQAFATPAEDFVAEAEVKNFGQKACPRQPVELVADGRRVTRQYVDLAPGGQALVRFPYRFDGPGDHVLEVQAPGDSLDIDNHRWLVVPVKASISVLCVDGRPSGTEFGGATRYLALALSPQAPGSRSVVRAEVVPENRLQELSLGRYDCIFLADVAQFTAGEARLLAAYVRGGGSVVFFLGNRVRAERYNAELGGERPGSLRLLPARLGPLVDQRERRLDPLGYRHPMVEAFRGRERAGLLTAPVHKHVRLTIPRQSKTQIVLALAGGDPLIVEESIGRGRVVLVATSADTSWTALPLWPSFVPLVQEMLTFAVSGQAQQRNVTVGEPLGGLLPAAVADVRVVVRNPRGRNEPVRSQVGGEGSSWTYSDTMLSGVYSAQLGPPTGRTESFAVNVDTAESDLRSFTAEQLRNDVWPDVPFVHQTTWENGDQPAVARASRAPQFPGGLLYGVFVLLLVETVLARRFGHHD